MHKKIPLSFRRGLSRFFFPFACTAILSVAAPKMALADYTSWLGGNGAWTDASRWSNSTIAAGELEARFDNSVNSVVTVGDGVTVSFATLEVRRQSVSIELGSGSSFTSTNVLVGQRANFAPHLTFVGPDEGMATLSLSGITVGQPSTADGNRLTFSGSGLNATATSRRSIIGRSSGSNELEVLAGAKLALHSFRIGYIENSSGNKVTVTGAGSKISVSNTSGDAIEIGAAVAGGVSVGVHQSQLMVSEGGTFTSSAAMRISQITGTHSNSVTVTGANSKLEMTSGATLTISRNTLIGAGGSFVRVAQGGELATNGNIAIYGHDTTSLVEYGKNSLLIDAGGTLTQTAGNIAIGENALLRLASGGSLVSPSVQVASGGRFEAEGSGLGATAVTIDGGAVLAIGVEGGTGAQQLTIGHAVTLAAGSFLEVDLFASGVMDQLHLDSGGSVVLGNRVTLRLSLAGYDPVLHDRWTLVSGNLAALEGEFSLFELPELSGGLSWDLSGLNEAGGWELAVIPEPGTWFLTALGGVALLVFRQRRAKSLSADLR